MIPLVAESLLPSARDALDREMRAAFAAAGVEIQPSEETRAHIEEGVRSGLDCRLTVDECAIRVGLIADVDVVITATIDVIEERSVLRAAWLPVRVRDPRRITAAMVLPTLDGGSSVRSLALLLARGEGKPALVPVRLELEPASSALAVDGRSAGAGVLWLLPGRHKLDVEAPGYVATTRALDVPQAGLEEPVVVALAPVAGEESFPLALAAGIGVGITGLVVGGVGSGAALFLEQDLGQVMSIDERRQRQSFGVASVVVAGIGGALALVGAGLSVAGVAE